MQEIKESRQNLQEMTTNLNISQEKLDKERQILKNDQKTYGEETEMLEEAKEALQKKTQELHDQLNQLQEEKIEVIFCLFFGFNKDSQCIFFNFPLYRYSLKKPYMKRNLLENYLKIFWLLPTKLHFF